MGNGATASCTESAFNSALATAKEIRFDCGPLPITITLSSAKSIGSNVTINGGNKVMLDANHAVQHFNVNASSALTLTQITLVNGQGSCGGAVNVAGNAKLTLNETRFIGNHSTAQGGAVCVNKMVRLHLDHALHEQHRRIAWRRDRELWHHFDHQQQIHGQHGQHQWRRHRHDRQWR